MASGVERDEARLSERYALGAVLGRGSFGVVQLAVDRETGRTWACKVVPLLGGEDPEVRSGERRTKVSPADLLREVELQGEMRHSCITRLREAFIEDDQAYLILEYMSGGDLAAVLQERGSFTEEDTKVIFLRLLKGLDYMHGNGVVHRDVKPENLLLSCPEDPTSIKLSDFGLAHRMGSSASTCQLRVEDKTTTTSGAGGSSSPGTPSKKSAVRIGRSLQKSLSQPFKRWKAQPKSPLSPTQHESSPEDLTRSILEGTSVTEGRQQKTVGGTLPYTAPETLRALSSSIPVSYEASNDIWAAGAILYYLLSGYPPFDASTPKEIMDNVRDGRYEFQDPAWDLVSDLGKDLIMRLLQVHTAERMTAKEALQHPWFDDRADMSWLTDAMATWSFSTHPQFCTTDRNILLNLQNAIDSLEQEGGQQPGIVSPPK